MVEVKWKTPVVFYELKFTLDDLLKILLDLSEEEALDLFVEYLNRLDIKYTKEVYTWAKKKLLE